MATKTGTIIDVTNPGSVAPTSSSRPIVVTNHTMIANDPMMTPTKPDQPSDAPRAESAGHSEKIIAPPSAKDSTEAVHEDDMPTVPADNEPKAPPNEPTEAAEPEHTTDEPATNPTEPFDVERDSDAAVNAAEAKAEADRVAREAELEQLIADRTYAVPINAAQKRRSRTYVLWLVIVAIIVAIVLLDALLDAGVIKLSAHIPHTHFL